MAFFTKKQQGFTLVYIDGLSPHQFQKLKQKFLEGIKNKKSFVIFDGVAFLLGPDSKFISSSRLSFEVQAESKKIVFNWCKDTFEVAEQMKREIK